MNTYTKITKKLLHETNHKTAIQIEQRINSFYKLNKKNDSYWFSELCFCILTANSKAETAIKIQTQVKNEGFSEKTQTELSNIIKKHGHRFHNIKANYIVAARKFYKIKSMLQNLPSKTAREVLVKNIKGIGYKEASHFLRNVGYQDVAIIDRHILRFMFQEKLINQIPKTITPKKYLEFENILSKFGIPLNKLDLIIWAKMTGIVLK